MTELTVVAPQRASLPDKIQYAKALAASNLLPRQYQGNPANLLFALEYAEALHVAPINAITSIHVIEGKPSASADLIAALVRRAGHKLRVTGDDRRAVAQLVRADDPEFVFEVEWTLERARVAGLTGKGVWRNYPAAMLRSRAITEVARAGASDALFGIVYTPEELGAATSDGEAPELTPASDWGERIPSDRAPRPVADVELPDETVVEVVEEPAAPPPEDEGEPLVSPAQRRTLHPLFIEVGVRGSDDRHAWLAEFLGHPVESTNDITVTEAGAAIDELHRLRERRGSSSE